MPKHIVDCKKHTKIDVPLTPEEETEQQERVTRGAQRATEEAQQRAEKAAALDRLRNAGAGQSWIADLLLVLGLDEPVTEATVRTKKAP